MQVFTYVCEGTVESRIAEIINGKRLMADLLVDGMDMGTLARWDLADLLAAAGAGT